VADSNPGQPKLNLEQWTLRERSVACCRGRRRAHHSRQIGAYNEKGIGWNWDSGVVVSDANLPH